VSATRSSDAAKNVGARTTKTLLNRINAIYEKLKNARRRYLRGNKLGRLYPKQPLVGVGAVIICNGKILLEKRKGEPGRGKWTVPGGLVELGETVERTLMREVEEETSLKVKKPELIDVVSNVIVDGNSKIKYHFVIVDYFVKLEGGTLKAGDDAAELIWVTFDDVESYDLTKSFREFFRRNRQRLEKLNSCL
jgi:8-oxo-dGTP diphosphatase